MYQRPTVSCCEFSGMLLWNCKYTSGMEAGQCSDGAQVHPRCQFPCLQCQRNDYFKLLQLHQNKTFTRNFKTLFWIPLLQKQSMSKQSSASPMSAHKEIALMCLNHENIQMVQQNQVFLTAFKITVCLAAWAGSMQNMMGSLQVGMGGGTSQGAAATRDTGEFRYSQPLQQDLFCYLLMVPTIIS